MYEVWRRNKITGKQVHVGHLEIQEHAVMYASLRQRLDGGNLYEYVVKYASLRGYSWEADADGLYTDA